MAISGHNRKAHIRAGDDGSVVAMRLLLEAGGPGAGAVIALLILFCAFLTGAAAAVLLLLRAAAAGEGRDLRVRPPSRAAAA
ncbi:MAG: hypothetical protein ACYCU3_20945, partial [Streptosporangiaceae bacterium]